MDELPKKGVPTAQATDAKATDAKTATSPKSEDNPRKQKGKGKGFGKFCVSEEYRLLNNIQKTSKVLGTLKGSHERTQGHLSVYRFSHIELSERNWHSMSAHEEATILEKLRNGEKGNSDSFVPCIPLVSWTLPTPQRLPRLRLSSMIFRDVA